jgi:NADH-quinone oxidoreductase subunit A
MMNSDYKQGAKTHAPTSLLVRFDNPGLRLTLEAAPHQRYYSPSRFSLRERRVARGKPLPQNYVPVFIFIAVVGTLIPITLLLTKLVRPDNPQREKLLPYECGIDPVDRARGRYTVRYYIVAILFVVFDVETIFLFPWAVKFKFFGLFGLLEMLIFLGILIVGYIWIWQKGALEWV